MCAVGVVRLLVLRTAGCLCVVNCRVFSVYLKGREGDKIITYSAPSLRRVTFALGASFGRVLEFPRLREIVLSLDFAAYISRGVRFVGPRSCMCSCVATALVLRERRYSGISGKPGPF